MEVEAANYLSTAKELNCLHKYPIIKLLFLKYNIYDPNSGHTVHSAITSFFQKLGVMLTILQRQNLQTIT